MKINLKYMATQPDEMLDWVDENDQIITQIDRKTANSDPKYTHREIGIMVRDKDGKFLWQKRSKYKTVNPGMWSITAGHIEAGQDPLEAAHKEISEELGFDTDLEFIEKKFITQPNETHFMYYYLANYNDEKINFPKAEVEEVRFMSKDDLSQLINQGQKVNKNHFPILDKLIAQ